MKTLKPKDKKGQQKYNSFFEKYSFLIVDLNEIDIEAEYKRLKSDLKLGKNRMSYDALAKAIDFVAENAFSAGKLFIKAKEYKEYFEENVYRKRIAELSEKAIEKLRQKKVGQISEEKIKNWICTNFEEEYLELTNTLKRLQLAEDMMKILYNQWESRKSLLQTQGKMVEKRGLTN